MIFRRKNSRGLSKKHNGMGSARMGAMQGITTHSPATAYPNKSSLLVIASFVLVAALFLTIMLPLMAFAEDENNSVNTHQLPDSSFIYDTDITDLSTADSYLNNQTVQVVGEVVGDNIKADGQEDYGWILLSSLDAKSNASITVYMSKSDIAKIDTFGKYGKTGTTLRVRGTFHLVCSEHEGLSDMHADYVSVVSKGQQVKESFDWEIFIPGSIVVAVGIVVLIVFYRVRERRR